MQNPHAIVASTKPDAKENVISFQFSWMLLLICSITPSLERKPPNIIRVSYGATQARRGE
jgi:hypothetical protein